MMLFQYEEIINHLKMNCEMYVFYNGVQYGVTRTKEKWCLYKFYDEGNERFFEDYQSALNTFIIEGKTLDEILKEGLYEDICIL